MAGWGSGWWESSLDSESGDPAAAAPSAPVAAPFGDSMVGGESEELPSEAAFFACLETGEAAVVGQSQ